MSLCSAIQPVAPRYLQGVVIVLRGEFSKIFHPRRSTTKRLNKCRINIADAYGHMKILSTIRCFKENESFYHREAIYRLYHRSARNCYSKIYISLIYIFFSCMELRYIVGRIIYFT